jgi:hypothetical protein
MPAQERIGPMPKKALVTESFELEAGDMVGEDSFTQSSNYTSTCRFPFHSSFLHFPVAQKPWIFHPLTLPTFIARTTPPTHVPTNRCTKQGKVLKIALWSFQPILRLRPSFLQRFARS